MTWFQDAIYGMSFKCYRHMWYLYIKVTTTCLSVGCSRTMAARDVIVGIDDRLSVLGFHRCILTRFHILHELLCSSAERHLLFDSVVFSSVQTGWIWDA
jgi:hypothetical protein